MGEQRERPKRWAEAKGGRRWRNSDDVFSDKTVVNFCYGHFLDRLPDIVSAGRPRQVIWFICMTRLFDAEKVARRRGWIDWFGFNSAYQRTCLIPKLTAIRSPVRVLEYHPFFNARRFAWRHREWDGTYRVGRIS